jgi:probable HAF family extracellular repeat protein
VVAGTTSDNRGVARAAIWRDARVQLLPGIPGHFSRAEGINDRGQVVGIHTIGLGALRGYVWHRGRLQDLEPVGPTDLETAADDIDEAGTVVGYSCGDGSCRPARWRNGVGEYLPLPSGGLGGDAAAIDSGQAVGSSFFRDDLGDRYEATQWDAGGDPRPLEVAGAGSAGATGIAGRFVSGWALSPAGDSADAVAWRDGIAHILPTRQATDGARAEDVDAHGRVVGMMEPADQPPVDHQPRAVLWRPVRSR